MWTFSRNCPPVLSRLVVRRTRMPINESSRVKRWIAIASIAQYIAMRVLEVCHRSYGLQQGRSVHHRRRVEQGGSRGCSGREQEQRM